MNFSDNKSTFFLVPKLLTNTGYVTQNNVIRLNIFDRFNVLFVMNLIAICF